MKKFRVLLFSNESFFFFGSKNCILDVFWKKKAPEGWGSSSASQGQGQLELGRSGCSCSQVLMALPVFHLFSHWFDTPERERELPTTLVTPVSLRHSRDTGHLMQNWAPVELSHKGTSLATLSEVGEGRRVPIRLPGSHQWWRTGDG